MNRTLRRVLAPALAGTTAVVAVGAFGFGGAGGPDCVGAQGPGTDVQRRIDCGGSNGGAPPPSACVATAGFSSVSARPRGRGLSLRFSRRVSAKATVDIVQQSRGRVIRDRRVATLRNGNKAFNYAGKGLRSGVYIVRFGVPFGSRRIDYRRLAVERRGGRFRLLPDYFRRATCDSLAIFKLERPVFGGTKNRPLGIAYRLQRSGPVTITVLRGKRVLKRFKTVRRPVGKSFRVKFSSAGVPRGATVKVRLKVGATTATLVSRRL